MWVEGLHRLNVRFESDSLGANAVVLMRGHGAVVVGTSLPQAVFRSIYTEVNAKLQGQALGLSKNVVYLATEEARLAEATIDSTIPRVWELWRRKALAKP